MLKTFFSTAEEGKEGRATASFGKFDQNGPVRKTFDKCIDARIIYIRFHTKSGYLLPGMNNQNIEADIKKLIVEIFGHL